MNVGILREDIKLVLGSTFKFLARLSRGSRVDCYTTATSPHSRKRPLTGAQRFNILSLTDHYGHRIIYAPRIRLKSGAL
jgi:hypothetical protein